MEELKRLVEKLSGKDDRCQQIKILQEIAGKLLREYYVKIDEDLIIEPLRLEAYYYHPSKFDDETSHQNPQQKTFDRLYLHTKEKINLKTSRKGGVDICLALNSDDKDATNSYFLSFLIKNSRVRLNGKKIYCKQIHLNAILNQWAEENEKNIKDIEKVLVKKEESTINQEQPVFYTARVGLKGKPFGKELLGALIEINTKINPEIYVKANPEDSKELKKTFFNFVSEFGKEWTVAEYMRCHYEEDRKAQCKNLIGYNSSNVLRILEKMERESKK